MVSLHIVDQNRLIRNWKIDSSKSICSMLRITWYAFFGVHYKPTISQKHTIKKYSKYQKDTNILNILLLYLRYQYNYIDITILLSYCNYIVTIIINTTYSYIYRYNLSIKIYNNQYRYDYIYSIIGMILDNTEINIYTVYSLHNIQ